MATMEERGIEEKRIRQLIRAKQRIGHSFAFWLNGEIYATKRGRRIDLFVSKDSSSKPEQSRRIGHVFATIPSEAYCNVMDLLEAHYDDRIYV